MAIISTTLCYPNAVNPAQGVFVQRRLAAICKVMPVRVVVPVPWFPVIAPSRFSLGYSDDQSPPVWYSRMSYLPGVAKSLDAQHYARALLTGIEAIRHASDGEKIDLIDAHFEWPDGVGGYWAARRLGVPFVCTLRGKLVSRIRNRAQRRMIREMLLGANGLIAVSKSLADLACEVAGKELGVHVIPNGIDGEIFKVVTDRRAARLELGWAEDARYLVSVGHLQELKGFHHLVGLLPSVRQRGGDVRLVLVGGQVGERGYEARLRSQIAASGLEGVVTLTGRVEPKRITTMLNAADLFVLASRSEGWCNAIAEALACGCPVVATEVGGNEELMSHWGLGRLVPFGQWEAFANRVLACLEEDWDRAKIAEFGGRRSWQQVAAECVDVFQRVLHRA